MTPERSEREARVDRTLEQLLQARLGLAARVDELEERIEARLEAVEERIERITERLERSLGALERRVDDHEGDHFRERR